MRAVVLTLALIALPAGAEEKKPIDLEAPFQLTAGDAAASMINAILQVDVVGGEAPRMAALYMPGAALSNALTIVILDGSAATREAAEKEIARLLEETGTIGVALRIVEARGIPLSPKEIAVLYLTKSDRRLAFWDRGRFVSPPPRKSE